MGVDSSCGLRNVRPRQFNLPNRKFYLTTKHTKGSDIDIFKLLNFVLFVTSFENTRLG
jgi:hypothetical protein